MTPDLFAPPPAEPPAALGPRRNIYVGTCSWTDPSLIKAGTFYPRGCSSAEARLRHYASQFPVVEVDSSFFAMPTADNARRWVERTPDDFRFNVKAFRLFTGHHTPPEVFPPDLRPLLPAPRGRSRNLYYRDVPAEIRDELWRRFIEALAPLKAAGKLTAAHFQFAPWVGATRASIEHVEECAARMAGHLVAVEFRHESWLEPDRAARTVDWERELGVAHVVVDEPAVGHYAHAVWELANPALAVVRLHGRNAETWDAKGLKASSERFNYDYPDDELEDLAARTLALAASAFMLMVLVNVNYEDQGIKAARRLQALLERLGLGG